MSETHIYRDYANDFLTEPEQQERPIKHWKGQNYRYTGTHYEVCSLADDLRRWLLGTRRSYSNAIVENVLTAVQSLRQAKSDAPSWQEHSSPEQLLSFKNGILDLSKFKDGEPVLLAHSPDFFSVSARPYDFSINAVCPTWLRVLDEVFQGDEEQINLWQEWCGYCMTGDTSLQKFMVLYGVARAGKSTLLSTLELLVGNSTGYDLWQLAEPFGLVPLVNKQLACVEEVHLAGHRDKCKIAGTLKSIIGEGTQCVAFKHSNNYLSVKLPVRFTISCNSLPAFKDSSAALNARMLVLRFERSFFGEEDTELKKKLADELAGIANWSLQGLVRLRERGAFSTPFTMAKILNDATRQTTPFLAFLRDCCVVNDEYATAMLSGVQTTTAHVEVEREKLWDRLATWCNDYKVKLEGDYHAADLRDLIPKIKEQKRDRRRVNGKLTDFYTGIGLKPEDDGTAVYLDEITGGRIPVHQPCEVVADNPSVRRLKFKKLTEDQLRRVSSEVQSCFSWQGEWCFAPLPA